MRPTQSLLRAAILLLTLLPALPARAQPVRLLASDARGVTLRVDAAAFELSAPDPEGRVRLVVPGYRASSEPGRPQLPFAQALLALPPGATARARVTGGEAEEERADVKLAIGPRPVFVEDPGGLGPTPSLEAVAPLADGPWPAAPVAVGEPFTLRGQRVVAVQVWPFRADEASSRLWIRRALVVRVDFAGGAEPALAAPAEDRHWEPVFESALLNYEQGRRWREPAAGPAAGRSLFRGTTLDRAALPAGIAASAAFDENEPEVRVRVDTTGVYGLDFDALAAQGYPGAVPVAEVSLHRHEFVQGATPPYVTLELPIEVDDANGNGVFDSGDRILAFVRSWAERSGASIPQREWGDGEVVYATRLRGGAGQRLPVRPGWRNASVTPLASYPWRQRWERSFGYYGFPNDTTAYDRFLWTPFTKSYYYRPDTIRFETNHLDTSRTVTFRGNWEGISSSTHFIWAQVKNGSLQFTSVADSVYWFAKDPVTVTTVIHGSALSEGNTNTFRDWGKNAASPPDPNTNGYVSAGLNWFEATYWRGFRALRGTLDLNSADAADLFQVHAFGFATDLIRVYDVTDPANPARVQVDPARIGPDGSGGYAVDFQDSTGAGQPRRYLAFDTPKSVPGALISAVTRRRLEDNLAADYLLVVPEQFLPAVDPLVSLRRAQGLSVLVAPLESVNDEFNGGRRSKWAIKRFVRYAYEHWQSRFLMLVGDGSEDGRHLLNDSGTDWIPAPVIRGPVAVAEGLEIIPSDPWYGWCLNDDPNCFLQPLLIPQVFVGRLPANSLQQATDMISKIVANESFAADQVWRRRMVLLADDAYSGVSTFGGGGGGGSNNYCYHNYELRFRTLNEAIRRVVLDEAGLQQSFPEVMDLRSYLTTPALYIVNGPGDTCRTGAQTGTPNAESILRAGFNPALFSRLGGGVLWWNYQGHANQYVLSHEGFYRNQGGSQDRDNLANDGKPFLFSAFSCHVNGFAVAKEADPQNGPSVGENLMTLANRGAVASWASSGFEVVPQNPDYHLNVELAQALFSEPPHDRYLGDAGARVVLGEVIGLTLLNYLPTVSGSSYERAVGLTYNLLGDPATRLSIGPPQILVTANGQPVVSGQAVRLGSTGDTLRIEADLVSNTQLKSLAFTATDGTGTFPVPDTAFTLTPAFPDTGAGRSGGRRFHLVHRTGLRTGSFSYALRTVDRYDVATQFDIVFQFETLLQAEDRPLRAGDPVAPGARLTVLVLSPGALDPQADLELTVDGQAQSFTATPARGDQSGRQWLLAWDHAAYAAGRHTVGLSLLGAAPILMSFSVVAGIRMADAMAFPNPFEDELGTRFSFMLESDAPADLLVRVYTASGRLVYERVERGLLPGYHQLPWDGRDAEGVKLANGIYFYRMVAKSPAGSTTYEGRLVKLRKPRRVAEVTPAP